MEVVLTGWTRVDADYYANQIDNQLIEQRTRIGETRKPAWRESRDPGYARALKQVRALSARSTPVLLEACITQEKEVETFRKAANADGLGESRVIQLKCSIDTALKRRIGALNVPTGWGPPHSRQRFMKIYEAYNNPLNTFSFDLHGAVIIETDALTPDVVLARSLTALE
jgi:hypothetical protein